MQCDLKLVITSVTQIERVWDTPQMERDVSLESTRLPMIIEIHEEHNLC